MKWLTEFVNAFFLLNGNKKNVKFQKEMLQTVGNVNI